jgi:hypothetical protein
MKHYLLKLTEDEREILAKHFPAVSPLNNETYRRLYNKIHSMIAVGKEE